MGYFTWTDARKTPRLRKDGEFSRTDLIARGGYCGYAKVVCPDNSEIIEPYYDGYGTFDGHDIYDLVVDWNKPFLKDIFTKMGPKAWGAKLSILAGYYQDDDIDRMEKEIQRLAAKEPYLKDDWKRNIGIAIACEDNEKLPFPIKITSKKWHVKYEELVPSISCQ